MPEWRADLVARLAPLRLAPLREAEIIEEMSAHLDDRYREFASGGDDDAEARRRALAELDTTGVLAGRLRALERPAPPPIAPGTPAVSGSHLMSSIRQDLVYGARMLRRHATLSIAVVAMLAIGIGANTAAFSIVNGLALRALPVSRPHEIVGIYTSDFSGGLFSASSYADVVDFRAAAHTCQGLVATTVRPVSLDSSGTADRLFAEATTANYFDVLGVTPVLGRAFPPDADVTRSSAVVVISDALWRRRFAADPAVVGTSVLLSGRSFSIIGVAPATYPGLIRGLAIDAWIPLAALPVIDPAGEVLTNRGHRGLIVMGRLAPGATVDAAQAEFSAIAARLHATYPSNWTDLRREARTVHVLPESRARFLPGARGPVAGVMTIFMVVVGLVLLVACANVANLLLARAAGRSREIATRLALGASRARLVRQLLTEGVLLAGLAGAAGLMLAAFATRGLMALQPPVPVPIRLDIGVDARVLLVTAGLTLLTALLCGLAPALTASRTAVAPALKDGALVAVGGRKSRLRHLLVITQVTVTLVLLVGAGLFLRSLQHATDINPGFDASNLMLAGFDAGVQGYSDAQGHAFYRDLLDRTRAIPGVRQATWATILPLGLDFQRRGLAVERYQPREGEDMEFAASCVGPRYFEVMGIRLVRGRDFTDRDDVGAPRVAIVNSTLARRFWPNADPIGRRITLDERPDSTQTEWYEVVGIAADGKYGSLGEEPRPFFYLPLLQVHESSATLIARTSGPGDGFFPSLRTNVAQLDRAVPVLDPRTMRDHLALSLLPARAAGVVLGSMGGVGLLLAGLGLHGVMAFGVARRTREIGIRLSLGASRAGVFGLVVRQGLVLTGIGAAAGLAISLVVTQALASLLYGVSPFDLVTFGGVLAVMAVAAIVASAVPAWRAMRVDPLVALRQD